MTETKRFELRDILLQLNRSLLPDVSVFFLNVFLVRWLVDVFLASAKQANAGASWAQAAGLVLGICLNADRADLADNTDHFGEK